jgi:uncharacterized protein (TIGR03067 family)
MSRAFTGIICMTLFWVSETGGQTKGGDAHGLEGRWKVASILRSGERKKVERDLVWTITKEELIYPSGEKVQFKVNAARNPKEIDVKDSREGFLDLWGIYALEGNKLTICVCVTSMARPTELTSKKGSGWSLVVLKRVETGKSGGEAGKP